MHLPLSNRRAEYRMLEHPPMKALRTAGETRGREDHERGGRQDRQEETGETARHAEHAGRDHEPAQRWRCVFAHLRRRIPRSHAAHRSDLRGLRQRLALGWLLAVGAATPVMPQALSVATLELTDHPLAGRIWDTRSGVEIEPQEVYRRAAAHRFVLLGETHDNPVHHELQARVLERIAATGRQPLVAWEMIDASHATALADCLARCEDWVSELPQRLEWATSGWPDWSLYVPIAAVAARYALPMAAANLSDDELRRILDGADVAESGEPAELSPPLPEPARAHLEQTLTDSHCGMPIPDARLAAMIRVQRARDRRMSAVLEHGSADDGSVLIAGSGHTRLDWGAGFDLSHAYDAANVLALAFLEVSSDCASAGECIEARAGKEPPWDVVWFTPRAVREDPCARLRS